MLFLIYHWYSHIIYWWKRLHPFVLLKYFYWFTCFISDLQTCSIPRANTWGCTCVFDMIHENGVWKLVSLLEWFTISQGVLLHQSNWEIHVSVKYRVRFTTRLDLQSRDLLITIHITIHLCAYKYSIKAI